MYTLKVANQDDALEIYHFCQLLIEDHVRMSFTDVVSIDVVHHWLADPRMTLYIAVLEDTKVIGMLRTKAFKGNKAHAIDLACAVDSNYRQHAVATSLTEFGLLDQKNRGKMIARTYIYSWNIASIKTIEKLGFTLDGRIKMLYYDPSTHESVDDLIYSKRL